MRSLTRDKDTICALATAHGLGAISVVRISGPKAAEIIRRIAAFLPENLESHKIYYGVLKDVENQEPLDEVLVSAFLGGRSFTGETAFEISCHGSEAVVNEILRNLVLAGARPAERGEFTYRAFMNGRMDLVQAESVLALIESRSKRASGLALRQLKGDLSKRLRDLCDQLTWILAHLEANIDFAAEDIEIASNNVLKEKCEKLLRETQALLDSHKQGRIIRNGFQVLLAGRPNAGKSSLLNALADADRAIVTPIAGTTRDLLEAEVVVEGVRVTIVDSAGLRVIDDPVEKIGVSRALEKIKDVDLVFYVVDSAVGVSDEDRLFFSEIPWERTVLVANKSDVRRIDLSNEGRPGTRSIQVSAMSGSGLEELKSYIRSQIGGQLSEDSTLLSSVRHFQGLEVLRKSLETAMPMIEDNESPDLIALELQSGLQSVYEILGLTYDDQVMDRVFGEFCLGK